MDDEGEELDVPRGGPCPRGSWAQSGRRSRRRLPVLLRLEGHHMDYRRYRRIYWGEKLQAKAGVGNAPGDDPDRGGQEEALGGRRPLRPARLPYPSRPGDGRHHAPRLCRRSTRLAPCDAGARSIPSHAEQSELKPALMPVRQDRRLHAGVRNDLLRYRRACVVVR